MRTPTTLPSIVKKQVDDNHFYWVNGEYYPGVTTILEQAAPVHPMLKQYFINNSAEEISKKSKDSLAMGSRVHDCATNLFMGNEVNLKTFTLPNGSEINRTQREKRMIVSVYNWFEDVAPTDYVTEHTIASLDPKFAGTLDWAGKIKKCLAETAMGLKNPSASEEEELWLVDFKTSAGVYFNYKLQVMAYKKAYEEMYGVKVDRVGIIRLGTRNDRWYEFVEVKENEVSFEDFEKVYDLYLKINGGKIPKPPVVDDFPDMLKISNAIASERV